MTETAGITPERRAQILKNARTLGTIHYVFGGLIGLLGLMFLVHVVIGLTTLSGATPFPAPPPGAASPPFDPNVTVGVMFLSTGLIALLVSEFFAILLLVAGRSFMRLRNRTFLLIVSGLNCLNQPLGLVLGIFGFIFLLNREVAMMFDEGRDLESPLD